MSRRLKLQHPRRISWRCWQLKPTEATDGCQPFRLVFECELSLARHYQNQQASSHETNKERKSGIRSSSRVLTTSVAGPGRYPCNALGCFIGAGTAPEPRLDKCKTPGSIGPQCVPPRNAQQSLADRQGLVVDLQDATTSRQRLACEPHHGQDRWCSLFQQVMFMPSS